MKNDKAYYSMGSTVFLRVQSGQSVWSSLFTSSYKPG